MCALFYLGDSKFLNFFCWLCLRSFLPAFPHSAVHWISLPPVPSVFSPLRSLSLPPHFCHLFYLFASISSHSFLYLVMWGQLLIACT